MTRKMRIFQVFEPGCDGVFRHVEQLCRYLAHEGVEIDAAYSSRRPSKGLFEFVAWIEDRGGVAIDLGVGPAPETRDLKAALMIRRLIKDRQPDVIHAHSSKAGALVRTLPELWRRPGVFYTPHAYFGMNPDKGIEGRLYNTIERELGRVGTTLNVSADEADFANSAIKIAPARNRVIPNPVECGRFVPASPEQNAAARARFGIPDGRVVVGYASRWTKQKDPETAYKLFETALKRDDRLHLLHLCKDSLLGDARSFSEKRNLADRITWVDYSEDVRPFFHACDVFLMSSRYEAGWPFVFIEALACGLPAAVTPCIGMSDVARSGLSACVVFPVGDAAAGADALLAACTWRVGHANNHREMVLSRFSPRSCFSRIVTEYRAQARFLTESKQPAARCASTMGDRRLPVADNQ